MNAVKELHSLCDKTPSFLRFCELRTLRVINGVLNAISSRRDFLNDILDEEDVEAEEEFTKLLKALKDNEDEVTKLQDNVTEYFKEFPEFDSITYNENFIQLPANVEQCFINMFREVLGELVIRVDTFSRKGTSSGSNYDLIIIYDSKQYRLPMIASADKQKTALAVKMKLKPNEKIIFKFLGKSSPMKCITGMTQSVDIHEVTSMCPFNLLCSNGNVESNRIFGFDWRHNEPKVLKLSVSWWPKPECWKLVEKVSKDAKFQFVKEMAEKPDEIEYPGPLEASPVIEIPKRTRQSKKPQPPKKSSKKGTAKGKGKAPKRAPSKLKTAKKSSAQAKVAASESSSSSSIQSPIQLQQISPGTRQRLNRPQSRDEDDSDSEGSKNVKRKNRKYASKLPKKVGSKQLSKIKVAKRSGKSREDLDDDDDDEEVPAKFSKLLPKQRPSVLKVGRSDDEDQDVPLKVLKKPLTRRVVSHDEDSESSSTKKLKNAGKRNRRVILDDVEPDPEKKVKKAVPKNKGNTKFKSRIKEANREDDDTTSSSTSKGKGRPVSRIRSSSSDDEDDDVSMKRMGKGKKGGMKYQSRIKQKSASDEEDEDEPVRKVVGKKAATKYQSRMKKARSDFADEDEESSGRGRRAKQASRIQTKAKERKEEEDEDEENDRRVTKKRGGKCVSRIKQARKVEEADEEESSRKKQKSKRQTRRHIVRNDDDDEEEGTAGARGGRGSETRRKVSKKARSKSKRK